jgi:hypothetical protein
MSFRATLSNFLSNVQCTLLPNIQKVAGELQEEHKHLLTILELIRIEEFLPCTRFCEGRPSKHRAAIARAFIAKIVFKLPYTKQLIKYLNVDHKLKVICGWDAHCKIPSESTFSRAFQEFAKSSLPDLVHQNLIKCTYEDQTVGHVVKDSTPIEVREKHLNKGSAKSRLLKKYENRRQQKMGKLNRRQKQLAEPDLKKMIIDLPTTCDRGMKKSSQGYTHIWKGYKLHSAVDNKCVPLAALITSASLNDCEAAIPLAAKSHSVVSNAYDLMDAAYDHPEIREHSILLGHIPIIDKCPHSIATKKEKDEEKKRKQILNFQTSEDKRYKERFPAERFNAMFKDYAGGRNIVYRGFAKVSCHIMFGVLTVAAATIIKLLQ